MSGATAVFCVRAWEHKGPHSPEESERPAQGSVLRCGAEIQECLRPATPEEIERRIAELGPDFFAKALARGRADRDALESEYRYEIDGTKRYRG